MKTNKIYVTFMLLIITVSIIGITYAHWADTIHIFGTAKIAHIKMTIISYKNLTSCCVKKYSNITSELSPDGHTLTITGTGLKPCWFIWIGLKTQNQGSLPAYIKPPEYSFDDPNDLKNCFETKEYYYGPYPEAEGPANPIHNVWGGVKVSWRGPLKPDGTVTFPNPTNTPPFIVQPGEKVIIWIWIHVETDIPDDAQGKMLTLYVNIVDDIAI